MRSMRSAPEQAACERRGGAGETLSARVQCVTWRAHVGRRDRGLSPREHNGEPIRAFSQPRMPAPAASVRRCFLADVATNGVVIDRLFTYPTTRTVDTYHMHRFVLYGEFRIIVESTLQESSLILPWARGREIARARECF
jgi:hypothetical protein